MCRAARRYSGSHEADELAAQMALDAVEFASRRPTVLALHLRTAVLRFRVEDARRRLFGRRGSYECAAFMASVEAAGASSVRDVTDELERSLDAVAPTPDVVAYLCEEVDAGEPIRSLRATRAALGDLPPTLDELAALAGRVCAAMGARARLAPRAQVYGYGGPASSAVTAA